MHTGVSVIWLSAFIALLLLNVAVVVTSNVSTGTANETPSQGAPLLTASDEVQLDWWAQNGAPGEGPSPLKAGRVAAKPKATAVSVDGGEGEGKDYPKLMAGYIKDLKQYLNEYFHITHTK